MNRAAKKTTYYVRRAFYLLRRAVEIGLFSHTPCPTKTVTGIIAGEKREQALREQASEKRADANRQQNADGSRSS